MNPDVPQFLDPRVLIQTSQVRRPPALGLMAVALAGGMVLVGALTGPTGGRNAMGLFISIAAFALLAMVVGQGIWSARGLQGEQAALARVAELLQLRRWTQASLQLDRLLAAPMRSEGARAQGLLFLATLLARYHRFADAVEVYDYLLESQLFDDLSTHGLKLARTMGLLHEDRLFDADRAINDLRRGSQAATSAGLALVEIYRDVKTGHPQEALEMFNRKLTLLRDQLGHRAGDAYALAARAHDLQGDTVTAADLYARATLLAPEMELQRRYPELKALAGKYPAVQAPSGEDA